MALLGLPRLRLPAGLGLGRVTGVFAPAKRAGAYQDMLTNEDFDNGGTTAGIANANVQLVYKEWILVGYHICPAQTEIAIGWGGVDQQRNQGRLYMRFDCTGAGTQIHGKVKVEIQDRNAVFTTKIFELRTERLSGSETDADTSVMLPEQTMRIAKEDDRIRILMKVSQLAYEEDIIDFDDADTKVRLPVTYYPVPK